MPNRIFPISLLAILICISSCAQNSKQHVAAIAFYNMENLFDYLDDPNNPGGKEFTPNSPTHYTKEIYEEKLHNLATVLQSIARDKATDGSAIIGCAEIENDKVLRDLVSQPEISNNHYKFVHYESPDARGIDVAMIYNPKLFTVIYSRPIHVDLSGTGGKETTRDILYVYGVLEGDTVNVLVNHWPSRRGGEEESDSKRDIAARIDKAETDSLLKINPAKRIIVMGDLNDDPTSPSVENILGANGDINSVALTSLYNPWMNIYQQGHGTLYYQHHWDLFDQIILSGEWLHTNDTLHWHYADAEIYSPDFLIIQTGKFKGSPHRTFLGNRWIDGYSDHFPVVVYLEKGKQ